MNFINHFSFPVLIILTILMGMAPFGAEPHLIEKWNMLMAGTLIRPLDIFDFIMHSAPIMLLLLKTVLWVKQKGEVK